MNIIPDAQRQAAKDAGLRYVDDRDPGLRRALRPKSKDGKSFIYLDQHGTRITDESVLARIAQLAIPPAYADVWICANPNGHLQATGRDARGRKQYRYHARWRELRDATKYERLEAFGKALPKIRRKVTRDLRSRGLPKEKVLAAILRLLESTLIRVGNEEYARDNQSFGLTTLRNRHVETAGGSLRFSFRGKSGIQHVAKIDDPNLVRIVRRCMDLPGQELFQYLDDAGERRTIDSADVNAYLREAAGGEDFTAKDYRTWAGSVMALHTLRRPANAGEDVSAPTKKQVVEVIKQIATRLGNTPAVCRKCYVHPAVLDAYLEGRIPEAIAARAKRGLRVDEAAFMTFVGDLARCAKQAARRRKTAS